MSSHDHHPAENTSKRLARTLESRKTPSPPDAAASCDPRTSRSTGAGASSGAGAVGGNPGVGAGGAGAAGGTTASAGGGGGDDPLPPGRWTLTWSDDFDGTSVDTTRWATQSDSYSDDCLGNQPDHKLEYNLPDNLAVAAGTLTITARRQAYAAPSGIDYTWTSGLITTGHACGADPPDGGTVHPGDYLQTRTKLPGALGMWPALWTDVYEYHPDNPTLLELTNHTGETDGTTTTPASTSRRTGTTSARSSASTRWSGTSTAWPSSPPQRAS